MGNTAVDDGQQYALLAIVVLICAACSFAALLARLSIRWPWRKRLRINDYIYFAATSFGTVQGLLTLYGAAQGLRGHDGLVLSAISSIEQVVYMTDLLYIATTYLTKTSVAVFFHQLCVCNVGDARSARLLQACIVCGVLSSLVLGTPVSWTWFSTIHVSKFSRWAIVAAMSLLLELCLVGFPLYLSTQLELRDVSEADIIARLALSILIMILSILRLISYNDLPRNDRPLYILVRPGVFLQLEMCCNLISATIPCLLIPSRSSSTEYEYDEGVKYDALPHNFKPAVDYACDRSAILRDILPERVQNLDRPFLLPNGKRGETMTEVCALDDIESMWDVPLPNAILVQQTVTVQYDPC